MLKIGLTGGIGSGKSTVARIFETLGIPVYYADEAAKRLMNTNEVLRSTIISHFGEEAYRNGELDRKYLAQIVFNDKEKLSLLNSLTHPIVIREANEWMNSLAVPGVQSPPYSIHEAALIFESNANNSLDYVIGVFAPLDIRLKRVTDRDKVSADEVRKRISRQLDEDEKMKRSDFVIVNDEHQLVIPQVVALHEKFCSGVLPQKN